MDIHAAYDDYANEHIVKPGGSLALIAETIERFWVGVADLPKVAR
jgi:hypothetical protein